MKAITICQPYADLICLPDDDSRAKRVENRTWPTKYRGPLLIHAGKSRQWLTDSPPAGMLFGYIIGMCELRDCVTIQEASVSKRWPWLKFHEHCSGPWCWVLAECQRFSEPIPYRGAQGLFDIPGEVFKESDYAQ